MLNLILLILLILQILMIGLILFCCSLLTNFITMLGLSCTFENDGKESIDVRLLPLIDRYFRSFRVYNPDIFYIWLLSITTVYSFIKCPMFYIFYIVFMDYLDFIRTQIEDSQHLIIIKSNKLT